MIVGRHDIDKLMRHDPASACLPIALGQSNMGNIVSDMESLEIESELSELLLNLRPIRQVCWVMTYALLFQNFLQVNSYILFNPRKS